MDYNQDQPPFSSNNLIRNDSAEEEPPVDRPTVNGSNCLSNLFYSWSFQLLRKSQGKILKTDDLPGLSEEQSTLSKFNIFE
jgi:hypothetical protein